MIRARRLACSALLGLALGVPALHAQPRGAAPAPQRAEQAPPPGQAQAGEPGGEPALAAGPGLVPVLAVTGVEVIQSTQAPAVSMIVVRGVASSEGWTEASLIPLVRGTPSDGMLDLVLVAEPPSETMPAAGFVPLQALLPVQPGHPYRGVRVRSATNVLAVRQLPGHAEASPPAEDCRGCVGRSLAGQGAASGSDTIAPASLPPGTRILRPEDGIADLQPNPNRLTLLLGEDGRVTEAVWH